MFLVINTAKVNHLIREIISKLGIKAGRAGNIQVHQQATKSPVYDCMETINTVRQPAAFRDFVEMSNL